MKKWIILLLCLCLCLPAACAEQAPEAPDESGMIGIISAMDNEIKLLLSHAEIDHVDTIGGVELHVGTLCGKKVVIAKAGIGKVLAASCTSIMLSHYPVTALVFTGIAGGVGDETQVLDIVIATKTVQHDFGQHTNEGFEWQAPEGREDGYYTCDPDLVETAYRAAVEVVGEGHVFKGVIATGDQFIASEAYVKNLQDSFDALACEMEGASVCAVCEAYGVPCVVIRSMSDKADGKAHETYENMADIAADNSGKIVMKMLEEMSK